MVDPDGGREPNPRTLSTRDENPEFLPIAQFKKDVPPPATKAEATAYASQARKLWEEYVAEQAAKGIFIDVSGDKVVRLTKQTPSLERPEGMSDERWDALQALRAMEGETEPKWVEEPDIEGKLLYDFWQSSLADAKEFQGSVGTARSFLDSEEDKTAEIRRQYKDFEDRASLVYDLMSDEQRFAMNADDQNAQNAASREKGYLLPAEGGYYSPFPAGGSLSQIIRPSLPDYVRPDYRLNAAVGLPGPQGFDDPDYDELGMPRFAYGTGAQSDTWFPGAVPTAGLPGQLPRMDYPSWVSSVAEQVMFNLRDGNPANDGKPAGWDESRYGDWETLAATASQYSVMPQSIRTRIYDWAQNTQDPSDLGWATSQIGSRPAPSPTDYTQTLTVSEQLALRKQAQDELETLLKYSGTPRNYASGSSGGSRSSGGGGGSSGTDYGARLGYEAASADIDAQLAREKFELQKQLMLLQFALDSDPNNPQLQLERDRLAEQVRQFDIAQAQKRDADEKAIQLQRARTIADYSANPGDAVAREYFLRQGINPRGTAVNVFTGQPTGEQMTLSEAMEANAPLVSGGLQGAVTGTPPPITTPDDEEEPAFAYGTNPKLTRDGWTRARKFIAGDPQVPGMVNPEKIQLRVRDGRPEAKVTPLSQVMRGGVRRMGGPMAQMPDRMPMFASGTDAWRISRLVANASNSATSSSGSTGGSTKAPQKPVYTPSPDYSYSGWVQTQTKGTPAIAPSSAGVDADRNGLDDMTGWANGVISDPSSPSGFSYNGIPTSSNGAPYTGPAPAIAPGGSPAPTTPTATNGTPAIAPTSPSADADRNGMDDRTGWAVGVVQDPASPSGFSYNGQPVESSGAPYNPSAPPPASTTPSTASDIPWYKQLYPLAEGQKIGNTIGNPYLSHILDGGSPTDIVQNRNSPYYGMTMEQAALLMHWANVNPGPQLTVVGPVADIPGMYDKYGNPLPYAQVNTQAEMGTLTGAELSQGKTQSVNPRLPGYRPPEGIPVSPEVARILGTIPGYTPPQSTLPVVSGGIVKSPDGGATYTLMPGDVQQPDGTYLRYNPISLQYEPVIPELTKITSREEFYALPEDVRQKILSGQPTGYFLAEGNTQWLSSLTNPNANFSSQRMMTQDEFNALSPEQQRALFEGDFSKYPELQNFVYAPGSYQSPSIGAQTEYGFPFWRPTGLAILPGAQPVNAPYNYSDYFTPEWMSQNYPPVPVTPTPITPTYPPGWEPGAAPAQGNTPTPDDTPPPAVPSAPPPPATGTTPPPPATGTTPPPASTATPTLSDLLGQLLGLSYGGDVYQNLPALQYAMGNLTPGEYDTISNAPIQVPGLGLTLPSASQMMNYEMLQRLIENGSFDLLNSLYTAGNVPLSLILAMARARAPLGSASEPTLIETT